MSNLLHVKFKNNGVVIYALVILYVLTIDELF